MPTVLVTAARGNVGRPLVRLLAARGVPVRAASRTPDALPDVAGASHVAFDLDAPDTWRAALAGSDALFVVPKNVDPDPETTLGPLLEAAADAGVGHVVLLSARGVDQAPDLGLHTVEAAVRAGPWRATVLRPTWFLQNLTTGFLRPQLDAGDVLALPIGDAPAAWVDTRDVAAVAAAVLTGTAPADEAFDLTGPEAWSLAQVADAIGRATARPVRAADVEPAAFAADLRAAGWSAGQAALMTTLLGAWRAGYAAAPTHGVARALGRPPRSPLAFVEDHVDAWRR